jgi:hypothetical protein
VDKEKRALARGEALGFTPGEPTESRTNSDQIVVYPGSVLDRFVAYANELDADAYWKVLDKTSVGKREIIFSVFKMDQSP